MFVPVSLSHVLFIPREVERELTELSSFSNIRTHSKASGTHDATLKGMWMNRMFAYVSIEGPAPGCAEREDKRFFLGSNMGIPFV